MTTSPVDLRAAPPPPEWGVRLDQKAILRLADVRAGHRFGPAVYDYEGTPPYVGEEWGRFVLLGVSVVWRLWPPPGERMWAAHDGSTWREDAPGIWTCFGRENRSLDLQWHISGKGNPRFFSGRGTLQEVDRRVEVMRQTAAALVELHDGSVLGIVERADGDARVISEILSATIPAYRDRPESPAGVLPFDKLANLAVTMLAARLPVHGLERLPVFPDYMLPRHLRHEGVLVYDEHLASTVDRGELLEAGSLEEMAIRWATIRAAEELRQRLNERGNPVSTSALDYWLWYEAVLGERAADMGRHHLCVTEAY